MAGDPTRSARASASPSSALATRFDSSRKPTFESGDRGVVDDARSSLHVRHAKLGHGDHLDDVAVEGRPNVVELIIIAEKSTESD
jgi:hypothetical protein